MANDDIKILIVDDDEINRECAEMNLERFIGYSNYSSADDGTTALQYLEKNPDVDVIFLDRMMNKLNGVPMLLKMNENPDYKDIIVIFQTGDVGKVEKQECIDAGSLYLLQKPYSYIDQGVIVNASVSLIRTKRIMKKEIQSCNINVDTSFTFKTMEEAVTIAAQLAMHFPNPHYVYEAIYELLINAVEHGNLEIGYYNKNNKLKHGTYHDELKSKLSSTDSSKVVTSFIEKNDQSIKLTIKDMGKGFTFNDFSEFGTERLREPNGRGIYKATKVFDKIEYINGGNEVICTLG
jgi:hypothetical protein